jgi:hypothetical protein
MARTKAERPSAAGIDDATRRKLERLREDCRRHPEHPVRMVWLEGPLGHRTGFEVALERFEIPTAARMVLSSSDLARSIRFYLVGKREEAAPARVIAWLERLGRIAEETRTDLGGDRAQTGFARAAQIVCAHEIARKRTVPLSAPTVERDERGGVHLIVNGPFAEEVEIEIPDAAAALAAAIDELLCEPSAPEREAAEEFKKPVDGEYRVLEILWRGLAGERAAHECEPISKERLRSALGYAEINGIGKVIERLRREGWPIGSMAGWNGGVWLELNRLPAARRDWCSAEFDQSRR